MSYRDSAIIIIAVVELQTDFRSELWKEKQTFYFYVTGRGF